MDIEANVELYGKGDNLVIIEHKSWGEKLSEDYIKKVAAEIYKNPKIEKTKEGFRVSGRLNDKFFLPGFVIETDTEKEKVMAKYSVFIMENDAGTASMFSAYSAFRHHDNIEELLKKYF